MTPVPKYLTLVFKNLPEDKVKELIFREDCVYMSWEHKQALIEPENNLHKTEDEL